MITQTTTDFTNEIDSQRYEHPILQSDLDAAVAEVDRLTKIANQRWERIQELRLENKRLKRQLKLVSK